nr:16S rRNA processing protein RimM [Bacteroides sp.]
MIARSEIFPVGVFNKPHGVNGEISATFDDGVDPSATDCVVVDIDGIYVPFFITALRPKGRDSFLLTIDGIADENQAKLLVNKQIFMRAAHRQEIIEPDDEEADGLYAADLIGFEMLDENGARLGRITDINDATANVLFVVESSDGSEILVPVADEFITDIDTERSTITVSLPDGLV